MKQKIIELYNSSYNWLSFISLLNKQRNRQLKQYFLKRKRESCYFQNKLAFHQALYNIKNDIFQYPTYSDGGLKIFKNDIEGYYTEQQYNNGIKSRKQIGQIKDLKYVIPALKHLGCGSIRLFNNKLVQQGLQEIFKQNYQLIPKKHIFTYASLGIYQPKFCKSCGQFIKYPKKSIQVCENDICKQTYHLHQYQYEQYLKNIFNSDNKRKGFKLHNILRGNKKISDYINNKLRKWFSDSVINKMTAQQKCYHIFYNIQSIPLCKHCGQKQTIFDCTILAYKSTCSKICNNKYIKNIEKRLANQTQYGSIGKNEYLIINQLFPNNTFQKGKVGPYYPDFINYKTKEIYEINQSYHLLQKKIKKDIRKYGYLFHNGWKINIIFNFYTKQLTPYYIKKILNTINKYKHLINSSIIFYNKHMKILTDTGWSNFDGVIKYNNRNIITVNLSNNKNISCTRDHKIYINGQYIAAQLLKHKNENKQADVYDIINVQKNNRFFINQNILVHNCLLLDQFAFIAPNMQQAFMQSVFPVISSSKNSQVIIVSTPNGTNNEYYRIWNKAILNDGKNSYDWHSNRIDWYDVPGRDEAWKEQQLATFNYNMQRFNQQYGNCFLGSAQTLIDADKIVIMQKIAKQLNRTYKEIQLHPEYEQTKIKIYVPPYRGRAYIIGADPATGSDSDYHAMCVWDITNLYNIELVADFHGNKLPPKFFAYMLAKTATIYNKAYIAIQNNGVSYTTLDRLMTDFEYQNIIHDGGTKMSVGIASSDDKKLDACLHFKQFVEDPLRKIIIPNKLLLQQMQHFQRRQKQGKMPRFACFSGNDDFIMSMIWAFYYLKPINLQNFYDIMKYGTDKFGNEIPLVVSSSQNPTQQNIKRLIHEIDKVFNKTTKSYALQMEQLKYTIQNSQRQLMESFISSRNIEQNSQKQINNIDPDTGQEMFQFDGFML